jgi:CBS domain-containing protein
MTKVREIMTPDARWLRDDVTVVEAAKRLAADDVGAVPVCDGEGHLRGMATDRDLVVKVIAEGRDPGRVTLGELVDRPEAVTIGADDSVEMAIETMKKHAVRRLPVIDGTDLVGVLSQADIARAMPDAHISDLVGAISQAPPNN